MQRVAVLTSKVEATRVLRRVGVPTEEIEHVLAQFPDPLDFSRALERCGLTIEQLTDRMGGSP